MNKNEENKLSDAIITLHLDIKKLGETTEKQFAKVNLALGEMRLSYIKLDERVGKLDDSINSMRQDLNNYAKEFSQYAQSNNALLKNHEARIVRLESREGRDNMVSEPHAVYKKTK